jgi:hypothetical protein
VLRFVNFDELTNLASIGWRAFYQCPLNSFAAPPLLREVGYQAFSGTRIRVVDFGDSALMRADLGLMCCLEEAILPRSLDFASLDCCTSLRRLTVGHVGKWGPEWSDRYLPGFLSELRFTSLDGRFPADFGPRISRSRVFSELAAVCGRLSRPILLP